MNDAGAIEAPNTGATLADPTRGLSVVSIAKSYDKKAVLSDVSLGVDRGEVLGLLGPNGAGKTTCFYSIMGLVKPDSGRILLDGQDITGLPMYRRARATDRSTPACKNLAGLSLRRASPNEAKGIAERA